ncbi:MAG TPA: PmoA family protein [Candidatus Hydrogenedentes bacterium]|nr:PmoA family protein [Candidatus Hydrogenedentota bacterium]HPG66897.1 PmoA family protein [Candidatus Hydrogenedentota bacterium]
MRFIAITILLGASMQASAAEWRIATDPDDRFIDVFEGDTPVLRYNFKSTEPPEGIDPALARGDYVHPLYGLDGEVLTDDYPKDHPHHRGVNWSWATIRWKGEDRDMFAVRGAWARPKELHTDTSDGEARIKATSVWRWDDAEDIVLEDLTIVVEPERADGRVIDFRIALTPLVDNLEFCGRLEAAYSGFNLRMAPAERQAIVFHTDETGASPRRSWGDYSAAFPGGQGRSGVTVFTHAANPGYPQEWREYPSLNFYQPLYPGGVPIRLSQGVVLTYSLWIHGDLGDAADEAMAAKWDAVAAVSSGAPR